jgi:hypothetical protein
MFIRVTWLSLDGGKPFMGRSSSAHAEHTKPTDSTSTLCDKHLMIHLLVTDIAFVS